MIAMMDRFSKFFDTVHEVMRPNREDSISKNEFQEASEMLTFSQFSGYGRLNSWLEKEIDRPVPVKPEMLDMISGITRQTTMKEVRDQLRRWVSDSENVLKRYKEGDNG